MIDAQRALGVTGLHLGATYEARARVAIAMRDDAAIDVYGRLTAQEYRYGHGSPLGTRYERLMDDVRRTSAKVLPDLEQFEVTQLGGTETSEPDSASAIVARAMSRATEPDERAQCALEFLCERDQASTGYLYLFDDSELRLVAHTGTEPVSEETLTLARELLGRARDAGHAPLPGNGGEERTVVTRTERRSYVLRYQKDGSTHYAGVAIVVDAPTSNASVTEPLIEAITAHLVGEAGASVRSG